MPNTNCNYVESEVEELNKLLLKRIEPLFKVGDLVRIKTPEENEAMGHTVLKGSAIDVWQNELCVVSEAYYNYFPGSYGYKLVFLEPFEKRSVGNMGISDFVWNEIELDADKNNEIKPDMYENLINGVSE